MRKFKPLSKAVESHLNRWLFVLALILPLGLGGCDKRDDQPDKPRLAHQQQLEPLSARLGAAENAVQQQKSAHSAAVGRPCNRYLTTSPRSGCRRSGKAALRNSKIR